MPGAAFHSNFWAPQQGGGGGDSLGAYVPWQITTISRAGFAVSSWLICMVLYDVPK